SQIHPLFISTLVHFLCWISTKLLLQNYWKTTLKSRRNFVLCNCHYFDTYKETSQRESFVKGHTGAVNSISFSGSFLIAGFKQTNSRMWKILFYVWTIRYQSMEHFKLDEKESSFISRSVESNTLFIRLSSHYN